MSVEFDSLQKILSGPSLETLLNDVNIGKKYEQFVNDCITKIGGCVSSEEIKKLIVSNNLLNADIDIVDDGTKKYSSILLRKELNIPLKDTSSKEICVFLNMMPTVVASSMVPYLDIEFETMYNGGTFSKDDTPLPPGYLRFFLGSKKGTLSGFDQKLYDGSVVQGADNGDGTNSDYSYMGMEMFTSPVTLTNATPYNREVEILNPLTALASINSFNITVAPSGTGMGLLSFKTAKLEMTIHDRSRIGDFSQILNPQLSKSTTLWVTYGWRYNGATTKDDPYSVLINGRMLWRERYRIKTSSYSFDGGGVKVTIELFTDGETQTMQRKLKDVLAINIGTIEESFSIPKIENSVKELAAISGLDTESSVIGNDFLSTILRRELPEIKEGRELKNKLDELRATLIGQTKNAKVDIKKIDDIIKLIQENFKLNNKGTYKKLDDFKKKISDVLTEKMNKTLTENVDIFLHSYWQDYETKIINQPNNYLNVGLDIKKSIDKNYRIKGQVIKDYVSYGKLFKFFIANTALATPGIDEVQVFFGDLNKDAVCVGPKDKATDADVIIDSMNIAEYPIDVGQLLNDFRELIARRGSDNVNISDALTLLNSQLNDVRGVAYGFRRYVLPDSDKGDETKFVGNEEKSKKEYERLKLERNFVTPQVGARIEVVRTKVGSGVPDDLLSGTYQKSARALRIGEKDRAEKNGNILRITVVDGNYRADMDAIATAKFSTVVNQILNQENDQNTISILPYTSGGPSAELKKAFNVQTSLNKKNLSSDLDKDRIYLKFETNKAVKDFVTAKLATIQIGAQGSLVTSVGASTNTDKLDSSSRMIQKATQGQSFGALGINGTPLRVYPAQVTMTTMGCPIFEFGQSFYIDFNTGTDLDNKYVVTGITHSFSPGKFSTSLNFKVADTYGQLRRSSSAEDLLKMVLNTLP